MKRDISFFFWKFFYMKIGQNMFNLLFSKIFWSWSRLLFFFGKNLFTWKIIHLISLNFVEKCQEKSFSKFFYYESIKN